MSYTEYTPTRLGWLRKSSLIIWILTLLVGIGITWAYFAKIDEMSTGTGKVISSAKEQVIQSLEGGLLAKIHVQEGQLVKAGDPLVLLDQEHIASSVEESTARLRAAMATAARLSAEVNGSALSFPAEVQQDPDLVKTETALYYSRTRALAQSLAGLQQSRALTQQELNMTEPLSQKGAISDVEILRLRRQINEVSSKINDVRDQYYVKAREELAKANNEIEVQTQIVRGRTDTLTRSELESPVRGIVKNISSNTVGGVIPPNGEIMRIIPVDERLQIETKVSPRDIAYIRPGLPATVKLSAYDYAIYGGLTGQVELISPDTLQDEVKRDQYYYRVYIRLNESVLHNKAGKELPIVPGMIATVDIHTGQKTVLDYLIKPFNKAREALRER